MWKPAIGGLMAGVIGALVVSRLLAGPSELPDVRVVADAEPLRCTGTEISLVANDEDDEESPVHEQIALVPGMQCQVRFFVVNDGDSNVTIDNVTMPFMGSTTGAGLHATHLTPWRSGPATFYSPPPMPTEGTDYKFDNEGIDATWTVRDKLLGEDRLYYEVWVEFNSCQTWSSNAIEAPLVYLDGDETPIQSTAPPVAYKVTEHSHCAGAGG